ncbi:MAG: diaminopimelate epimerase [Verrucomicrobia bacterium]|nr:MAG: diaminopimelate epimerase [Verrucomicrobiota bacterium]
MNLSFTKMNGAGNDFILMDNREGRIQLTTDQIARLCDRHRGIGADGLLLVEPATGKAEFRMRYYNSDGREAEMCGNGTRCFLRYALRISASQQKTLSFETPAGVIRGTLLDNSVEIQMSTPRDHRPLTVLQLENGAEEVHFINTGVPHAVIFVEDVGKIDISRRGAELRHHAAFLPAGANANFIQVLAPNHLRIRTYERGVENETLACGTGVVASALLHHLRTGAPSPICVVVQSGDKIEVSFENSPNFQNVRMRGPAEFVFDGEIEIPA